MSSLASQTTVGDAKNTLQEVQTNIDQARADAPIAQRAVLTSISQSQRAHLVALLEDCYGGSPWNESYADNRDQADSMIRQAARPEVRSVVLVEADSLVGVAQGGFGDTFLADLRSVSPEALPDPPVFELRQLAVHRSARGRGLGPSLHDEVMDGVTGPALLVTHPQAEAALALYGRRGWQEVGRITFGEDHPRVIMRRA